MSIILTSIYEYLNNAENDLIDLISLSTIFIDNTTGVGYFFQYWLSNKIIILINMLNNILIKSR